MLGAIVDHPFLSAYFVLQLGGMAWIAFEIIQANRQSGPPPSFKRGADLDSADDEPSRSDELLTIPQVAA